MREVDAAENEAEERPVLPGQTMAEIERPRAGGAIFDRLADERFVGGVVTQRREVVVVGDVDVGDGIMAREIDEPPVRRDQPQRVELRHTGEARL